jgi:phosphoribosylformylglycinamidine cyclo-ligase
MRASGLHSNGYSLARHVLLATAGLALEAHVDVLGRTLGEELLEPTRIYSLDCLDLARAADVDVHAFSHVTGGGLAANLARVLPADIHVVIERGTWAPHPVFGLVGDLGQVALPELEKTFNMGVGMIAMVAPESVAAALARLAARGVDAWVLGEARPRPAGEDGDAPAKGGNGGAVSLTGTHAH